MRKVFNFKHDKTGEIVKVQASTLSKAYNKLINVTKGVVIGFDKTGKYDHHQYGSSFIRNSSFYKTTDGKTYSTAD